MYADMERRLELLQEQVGVEFKNRALLLEAVTHRSYLNENRQHPVAHNELLEFLGDAALEIVVTEYLFKRFRGKATEGVLTNWRAALVSGRTCGQAAQGIGLESCLLMSNGQRRECLRDEKVRSYLLANAFEALLGAIYIDQGLGMVRLVADSFLISRFSKIIESSIDAKSILQEVAQAQCGATPHYRTLKEWGPSHRRNYRIGVYVNDKKLGEGEGRSKKEAQEAAAKVALQTLNANNEGRSRERG